MGKETRERNRSQRINAPYNVANSSFAKRFTSKVAEYIPSGWVSNWFENEDGNDLETSLPNTNSTRVQVEINNVDSNSIQPNAKRPCIPNHNNVNSNRTVYLSKQTQGLGNETCSPILNADNLTRDLQVPGPSGFNQQNQHTHKLFVASTPAFNSTNKQTSGDNGSESGESTSGCSSLVSQSNKMRSGLDLGKTKALFPNRQIPTDELNKMNKSGPQFDSSHLISNSPTVNKSINLSPFYPGNTTFGGASTYRKSLGSNRSTTSPSVFRPSLRRVSLSNQTKVNASPSPLPQMSVVAENILKTINAMTPISRIMTLPTPEEANEVKTPLRGGSGVKRKLPELQIPTVVDLIQLRRSERLTALSNPRKGNTSQVSPSSSSSSSASDDELDNQTISYDAKRSLQQKIKRSRQEKSRRLNEKETDQDMSSGVNLPNAVLNVSSLPVIDISLAPPRTKQTMDVDVDFSFSDPIDCNKVNLSSESSMLSISSNQGNDGAAIALNTSVNFVYNSESSQLKPKPRTSITLPPVEVANNKNNTLPNISSKPLKESTELVKSPLTSSQWKCTVCMMKHGADEVICKTCGLPKANQQLESIKLQKNSNISDLNKLTTAPTFNSTKILPIISSNSSSLSNTSTVTNSLLDSFKPPSDTWECSACCVRNKTDADKCICCTTPKPGAKPSSVSAPSTSSQAKSIASTPLVSSGFGDMFKKPAGNWECSICMVSNKIDVEKCVACETPKPGAKPTSSSSTKDTVFSGPKFPFDTSTTSNVPAFKFGFDKVDSQTVSEKKSDTAVNSTAPTSTAASFSFGVVATSSAQSSSTPATFSFGIPKSESPSTAKTSTINSTSPKTNETPVVTSNSLVPNGKEEKPLASNSAFKSGLAMTSPTSTALTSSLFANATSSSTLPTLSFASPTVSTVSSDVKPSISAPTFSFGSTNGPVAKVEARTIEPKSADPTKESPKPSIFGSTPSFLPNNVGGQKPVTSLFGTPSQVNNSEPKGLVNLFSSTPEPAGKKVNFGLPATENKPTGIKPATANTNFFGSTDAQKPKDNVFSFGSTNNTNQTSTVANNNSTPNVNSNDTSALTTRAFPSKPDAVFSFGSNKPVGNAFPVQQTTPNNAVFSFGGSSTAQPTQSSTPSFNFASPASTPGFSFGSNTTTPSFNNVGAQQPQQASSNLFGSSATTGTGESLFGSNAANPVFGSNVSSGVFSAPSQPAAATGAFQFGAPTTNNGNLFSFGAQNTPALGGSSNAGFSFGAAATTAPAFNPNIRPSFNFSGGAAPTFSAAPQPLSNANAGARRIKKAIRRR